MSRLVSTLRIATWPFRVVRGFGVLCVNTGQFFFKSMFNLIVGAFGLSLLFCVGFALYRMLVKPWFV